MDEIIQKIEKKYRKKGIQLGSSLLLKPPDALDFINEVEIYDVDIGISGITLWELLTNGSYQEVLGSFNFDEVPRDDNFVRESFTDSKRFLNELIIDPIYSLVTIDFESEKSKQERLENTKKKQ